MTCVTLSNGVKMPAIGLGTWKSEPSLTTEAVKVALQAGYRHIDCAWVYFNQKEVGEGIRQSGIERQEIFITSKLWMIHFSPELVEKAVVEILKDLGVDYLDQLLMHWPVGWKFVEDIGVPVVVPTDSNGHPMCLKNYSLSQTWKKMEELYERGILKSIGVSNFNIQEIRGILNDCKIKPMVNQIEVHPFLPNVEISDFCKAENIQVVAYSPFASPGVKGFYEVLENSLIQQIADHYNKTPANVAIRWSMQRGFVILPKSTNPERVISNFQVFDFELKEEEMKQIDQLSESKIFRAYNPEFRENGKCIFP